MKRFCGMVLAAGLTLASHALAQNTVKIGVLNDQSGPYSDYGGLGSVEAAKMAVEDFGGTVLGQKIEVVSGDHQNKSDLGSAIAARWYDREDVTAIADLTNSAVALAVQEVAKQRNKIALFSGPGTTRLIDEDCSPTGFMWTFDTYGLAHGTAEAIVKQGGDTWYVIAANYAFGQQMLNDLDQILSSHGGKIVGVSKHPINAADFSSYLLSAQASKAKIVGLANAGSDTINAVKQANEFGIVDGGQKLAAFVVVLSDVHALGLENAKGLLATEAFYHDRNDASRAWSARYFAEMHVMPGMIQASVYSAVLHYLQGVRDAGTTDGLTVAAKMREKPVEDFYASGATIRADGKLLNDMYLVEVKSPQESKAPWDYFKVLQTIPATEIAKPLSESKCYLVK